MSAKHEELDEWYQSLAKIHKRQYRQWRIGDVVRFRGKYDVILEKRQDLGLLRLMRQGRAEMGEVTLIRRKGEKVRFYGLLYNVVSYSGDRIRLRNEYGLRWVSLDHPEFELDTQ